MNRPARAAAESIGSDPHGADALYLSAGYDTRVLTLTHPAFLAKQSGRVVDEMGFYVYVDRESPHDDPAAKVGLSLLVHEVHVAPLHPAGHQHAVCVLHQISEGLVAVGALDHSDK